MKRDDLVRMAVVGGGPAGNAAATVAATLGAEVVLVEDSIVGGAAHLWDCIPSKAMVASSTRMAAIRMASEVGLSDAGYVGLDMPRLNEHLDSITGSLAQGATDMLRSQGVEIVRGRGRFVDQNTIEAETEQGTVRVAFDVALVSTGSRPWVPDWAPVDGQRILTTRHAYHLPELPEHLVIVGSGVTGVEMVHIFSSLGSGVSLLVSRQHVLPHRDAEVAAALEENFLDRGVKLYKGTRAVASAQVDGGVAVETDDGRVIRGSHLLLAVGLVPNSEVWVWNRSG